MKNELLKETMIEYCENMYALGIVKLSKDDNLELKVLIDDLVDIEDEIRLCNDEIQLINYKKELDELSKKIEVMINE